MKKVIAIDGPSSAGKSTIGLMFAQKIGYQFIDSGCFYRAVALRVARENLDIENFDVIEKIAQETNLEFRMIDGIPHVFFQNEDITLELHSAETTRLVPIVAMQLGVRDAVKLKQQSVTQDTVMSGRDIGTEVFPDSKLKFFVEASLEKRAERRHKELLGRAQAITYEEVFSQLQERDFKDRERDVSPLYAADDAILIDTSELSKEEVLNLLLDYYNKSELVD